MHDGGARRVRLELRPETAEDRLHVARRRGEGQCAGFAAAVVEAERERDARTADAGEAEPGDRSLDQPAQHEEERLEAVERVLERHRLLHHGGQRLGRERPLVLAACRTNERRPGRPEPGGHLGDGQAGEVAEPVDAPALERGRDVGPRSEAGEREAGEKPPLHAGGDHLRPVAVLGREPRHRHAGADPDPGLEVHAGRAGDERRRERGLAGDEVGDARRIEVDGAVGRRLDAARQRGGHLGQRVGGRALGGRVASAHDEVGRERAGLSHGVAAGPDAAGTRRA